jgi:hypothetical protein
MMTHSCSASVSKTSAVILAASIPNLHAVCRIMPGHVMFRFSVRRIRIDELYEAMPQPRDI